MRVIFTEHCVFAESRVPICEYAIEGGPLTIPARLRSQRNEDGLDCTVKVPNAGAFGPVLRIRRIEGPNLRIRNGRRSATASRSAQVSQRQIHVNFNGERDKTGFEAAA